MDKTRRPSRPRFSVSESESHLSTETQYTDLENNSVLRPSLSSGFFMQRSSSSGSGDQAHHLQQCETVIKSHHKLKVYFTVLFVVNVILIIIVIILIMFCVFFLMMARDAENKNKDTHNGHYLQPTAGMVQFNCPIKCKELKKYGFKMKTDEECCSLDDVVSHVKQYVEELVSNRPPRRPAGLSSPKPVIHLVGGKPSDQTASNPHFVQGWHCNGAKQDVEFSSKKGNDFITIPDNGLYFTYSRIHFTVKQRNHSKRVEKGVQMPVTHALYRRKVGGAFVSIQDSSLKCPMQNDSSVVHSSYLEGIAYLRKGEEIKIGLTYGEKLEYDMTNKDNYFGMFKL